MDKLDLFAGMIAIKDLKIKTLEDRIAQLENMIRYLNKENDELYTQVAALQEKKDKDHHVGFKSDKP